MPQPAMMVRRRPIKSEISPAMMAPKKVPAERMEVMSESLHDSRAKESSVTPAGG